MSPQWQPSRGEVALVRFPFLSAGRTQQKVRPAVVVSGEPIHAHTVDLVIAAISSRPASRPLPTDFQIRLGTPEATTAGLKKDSWVKVSNLATIPRWAMVRRLGYLTPDALKAVEERLRVALGL